MKKIKKEIKAFAAVCAAGLVFGLGYTMLQKPKVPAQEETAAATPEPTPTPAPAPTPAPEPTPLPKEEYEFEDGRLAELAVKYDEIHEHDENLVGILVWQSGLIEQPVFEGTDNSYYLYHAWETGEYRTMGSIAMDYRCHYLQEQNSTVYGHYVYEFRSADRTVMFTPLAKLMQQENYEPNKYLAMVTDDEVIYYEIAKVYRCSLINHDYMPADMEFSRQSFDEAYFTRYMELADQNAFYDTGIGLTMEDTLLTLQTCIENYLDDREIVVCRMLTRKALDENVPLLEEISGEAGQ